VKAFPYIQQTLLFLTQLNQPFVQSPEREFVCSSLEGVPNISIDQIVEELMGLARNKSDCAVQLPLAFGLCIAHSPKLFQPILRSLLAISAASDANITTTIVASLTHLIAIAGQASVLQAVTPLVYEEAKAQVVQLAMAQFQPSKGAHLWRINGK